MKIIRGDPNMYEIGGLQGESIISQFYQEEQLGVEKILKRKMVLVKWLGYDSKHNSWIPKSDIQNLA